MNNTRNLYWKIIIPAILLCIVPFFVLVKFQKDMEKREYEVLQTELQRQAELGTVIIERTLEGYIASLNGMAEVFRNGPLQTEENLDYLKRVLDSQEFIRLGIADLNGNLLVVDENRMDLENDISDRPYFFQVLEEKRCVVSEIERSRITGGRIFMVAVPVLDSRDQVAGVLCGAIRLEDFQPYKDIKMYDQQIYIQIIDKNGSYIVNNGNMHLQGDDSSFEGLHISQGDRPAEEIIRRIKQGEPVVTERSYGGSEYLVYFEPLQFNAWYLVVSVSKSYITDNVHQFMSTMVFPVMLKIFVTLAALYGIIVYHMRKSSYLKLEKEERLRQQLLADVEGFLVLDLSTDQILRGTDVLIAPYDKTASYSRLLDFWKEHRIEPGYAELVAANMSISAMVRRFQEGVDTETIEYPIRDESGQLVWKECVINVREENSKLVAYCIYRNISNKKQMELLLKEKAEKDYLTGLYNRSSCVEKVRQLFQEENMHDGRKHAFILMDLDNFKSVNDQMGHQAGDRVLQDVANILSHHFREYDVVCRLAGDEFVILLKDIPQNVVEKNLSVLLQKLELTYTENRKSVSISASVGVSFIPDHGNTFEELYRKADEALYIAKERGKNTFCIYSDNG